VIQLEGMINMKIDQQSRMLIEIINSIQTPETITKTFINGIIKRIERVKPENVDWKTLHGIILHDANEHLEHPYSSGDVELNAGRQLIVKLLVLLAVANRNLWVGDTPCDAVTFLANKFNGILNLDNIKGFIAKYIPQGDS